MIASSQKVWLKHIFLKIGWHFIHKKRQAVNRIPVLCYHRVLPEFIEAGEPKVFSILPEQFESQLRVLKEEGFNTLSLTEYQRMARGWAPIRERSVLLTFDDGLADNYEIAWKIAQKYNVKINLFICPGYVGLPHPVIMVQNGYEVAEEPFLGIGPESVRRNLRKCPRLWKPLTWPELKEMQDSGVQIGLHSHTHRNLALLSSEELVTDTAFGLSLMERELGQRPRFFALPYGDYESYNFQTVSILENLGLEVIFAAHPGRVRLPSRQCVFPRIMLAPQDNSDTFRKIIWGAYDWWGAISWAKYVLRTRFLKK